MRRLASSLAIALSLVAGLPHQVASAAPSDVASLRLVSQTPWVTADHPVLKLAVRAANRGERALGDLSLSMTLLSPVRSRSAYEQSLRTDPEGSLNLLTPPPLTIRGSLAPGESRTVSPPPIDVGFLSGSGSYVYPLRVELRSGFQSLATLRTPLVFLSLPPGKRRAETPLHLAWSFVLDAPVLHGPGGSFDGPAVSALLAPSGRLLGEVDSLFALVKSERAVPVDVVVAPLLLQQLETLSRGYAVRGGGQSRRVKAGQGDAAVAAAVLARLRTVLRAPSVEVSALPFASPNAPALLSAGLEDDLTEQVDAGRQEVRRIAGVAPVSGLMRPSRSFLDQATLVQLSRHGVDQFLLDSSMVQRPPQEKEFTQPATARLEVGPESDDTVTAVVADPGIESLLSSDIPAADPRLAAQAALAEMAQIWLEQPGVDRSVAMALTERMRLPGSLFGPLVATISGAPWVAPEPLSRMAERFRPRGGPATLIPRRGPAYPSWFVALLDGARQDLDTYRSMLARETPLPRELESDLLTAESDRFTPSSISGAGFVAAVRERLREEFRKVGLETAPLFTLPSRGGNIPVVVTSRTGYPIRVQVRLLSNRLDISSRVLKVDVEQRSAPLLFHVQAKTTGRFPVQVQILTPSGVTLDTGQLVVRSTAYNMVALLVTIGAAAFLLLWWARRFVPRKTA
jgi:Family of unknown function (DUF6049)